MSDGKSRYDDITRALMDELAADAVFLVVIGGERGNGSCPALRLFPGEPEANRQIVTTLSKFLVSSGEAILGDYEDTKRKAADRGVIL